MSNLSTKKEWYFSGVIASGLSFVFRNDITGST